MKQKNRSQIRHLLRSLLPIQALSFGLPAINSLLNGFIVGHFFKEAALAAVGFAGPVTTMVPVFAGTIASGAQLLCGQQLGRGDREGLQANFNTSWIASGLIGALLAAIMLVFSRLLAVILGASGDELVAQTAAYLRGLAPSMIFSSIFTCILPFLQIERAEKTSSAAVAVLLVINTAFNLLNAFVLDMGILGVGIATSVANLAAVAVCVPYFLRKSSAFNIRPAAFRASLVADVVRRGYPSAVSPLCSAIRSRVINQIIFSIGGTVAMAAFTVGNKLSESVGNTIEGGYSGSGNLIASVLVGERDVDSLRELSRDMISVIWPVFLAAYAALFIFAKPIAILFGAGSEEIGVFVMAIRVVNLWFISNIVKTTPLAIYRALGDNVLVTGFHVANTLIYSLVPSSIFVLLLGEKALPFVFAAPAIGEILILITFVVVYLIRRKKLPESVFRLTDIPSNFAVPAADRFTATIASSENVSGASQGLIDFCRSRGVDDRNSKMCGLCVEEMAIDSLAHNGGNGDFSIALRALYADDGVTILLRDNGRHFDPNEWLRLYAQEDADRSIGIKLVSKVAKEMNYSSALGLNVLTIRL